MENENKLIEEINEGAMDLVCEEVSTSNGNLVVKVVAGVALLAVGIGAAILYKKRKNKCEVIVEEIVVDSENVNNDEIKA